MVAPSRGFPDSEYRARLARAQRAMNAAGIDALLLSTEADIRWFTGFLTDFWQSPTRPWFLVVPADGKPVAVIPSIGEPCMRRTWIDEVRTWSSPAPLDDGVTLLAEALIDLAGVAARIGLPMGTGTHLRMPVADHGRLRSLLPTASWVDATQVLTRLRAIKSAAEIDKIRYTATAAGRAFAQVPTLVSAGMSDIEAFRAFRIACLQAGVDQVDYLVGAAGEGGYGDIISPPSGRTLATGDVLILDTGCSHDGYFCDFDRNWSIGGADAAVDAAYRIAWQATEAGLAAARPGALCCEVFDAMHAVLSPHAVATAGEVGRLGHGLGTQLTEPPSLIACERTELVPGMVMTLEPGYAFAPGRWMVHEENIVITETGCQLLSERACERLPRIDG